MRRREFITLLGGAAAWPLAARAQQPAKCRPSGSWRRHACGLEPMALLSCSGCANSAGSRAATSQSSIAGRKDAIERYAEIAAEFVRLKVDVIVTTGAAAVLRGKAGDIDHPDRLRMAGDPVGTGLVASLARPGGNVTGLSHPDDRSGCQAPRTVARDCPGLSPIGDHGQCRQSGCRAGDGRGSGCGRHARPRGRHIEVRRAEESRPPSRRSRAARRRFTSSAIRSSSPTGFASTPCALHARLPTIYPVFGSTSKREV